MWLNVIILSVASIIFGFILGWIVARPRRWEYEQDQPAMLPDELAALPLYPGRR